MFVRSQAGSGIQGVQRGVVDQLRALEDRKVIDAFEMHVWGPDVCGSMPHDGDSFAESTVGRVQEFEAWADERDVSVGGTFRHHRIDSAISDEEATVVSLPSLFLAVYEDDALVDISPCRKGNEVCSVATILERLATDTEPGYAPGRSSKLRPEESSADRPSGAGGDGSRDELRGPPDATGRSA